MQKRSTTPALLQSHKERDKKPLHLLHHKQSHNHNHNQQYSKPNPNFNSIHKYNYQYQSSSQQQYNNPIKAHYKNPSSTIEAMQNNTIYVKTQPNEYLYTEESENDDERRVGKGKSIGRENCMNLSNHIQRNSKTTNHLLNQNNTLSKKKIDVVTKKESPHTNDRKPQYHQTNSPTQPYHPSSPHSSQKQNLTQYLITKAWQNSTQILSPEVISSMKKLTIQWTVELAHYLKLKRDTLYHTLWIFERCLQKILNLNAENLQLLAITCIFISTKYEEIYPPHIINLIEKTIHTYNKKQIIDLEQKILLSLNFQLTAPNRLTFVNMILNKPQSSYLQEYDSSENENKNEFENTDQTNPQIQHKAAYLSKRQIMNKQPTKRYIDFVYFILEMTLLKSWKETQTEKQIADAVIYLADKVIKKQSNTSNRDTTTKCYSINQSNNNSRKTPLSSSEAYPQQQLISDNWDWMYLTQIQEIAYEIILLWKENKHSIISYLYDCDRHSFVGGLNILF